ncbi:hypothetical protein ACM614_14675 [Streptomyces sp. 12297]
MIERVMLRVVGAHVTRLTATRNKMEQALNNLLDDLDALHSKEPQTSRPSPAQSVDLSTLIGALDELATFRDELLFMLKTDEHGLQTLMRNEMEALSGLPRSYAPIGKGGPPAIGPPRPAAGTSAAVASGAERLFKAIETAPPEPVVPQRTGTGKYAPNEPLEAQDYGRQSHVVTAAAQSYVALFERGAPDPVLSAVRSVLAGQDNLAARNRMAIAILVAKGKLKPGSVVPKSGPNVEAGVFQAEVTGSSFEWTANLKSEVRGHPTVGIDGIVDGYVYDAKHTHVAPSKSHHFKGRESPGNVKKEKPAAEGKSGAAGKEEAPAKKAPETKAPETKPSEAKPAETKPAEGDPGKTAKKKEKPVPDEIQGGLPFRETPWLRDTTEDVAREMRPPVPVTSRELIAVYEERVGISVVGQMERQLAFARENGLRGVVWVTNSKELQKAFQDVLQADVQIPLGADLTMEIRVKE